MKQNLTYQTALISSKKKDGPLAVASSPIVVDTELSLNKILGDIDDAVLQNNIALLSAVKNDETVPPNAEQGTTQLLLEMYRAFQSGKFVMIACSRYPCDDNSGQHCLNIRFKPPAK